MIILTTLAVAGALLLVWAGIDHVREPEVLTRQLARLRAVRPVAARRLPTALGLIELAVGGTALIALVARIPGGQWAIGAQVALYLGFLAYLAVRYRQHDRDNCGCSRLDAVIGPVGLLRAGTQATVGAAAAIGYPATALPPLPASATGLALCLAASVVLCLLFHALPPAVDGLSRQRRYV
jgi:hypothetical protein